MAEPKINKMSVGKKMSVRQANDEIYPPKGNPAQRLQNWVGDKVSDVADAVRSKHSEMQRTIKSADKNVDRVYDPKGNPASQLGNYMAKKIKGKK